MHDATQLAALRTTGYIPFGSGLFFNPDYLLKHQPTLDEIVALPFDRICQYFRVIQQYAGLITWFKAQVTRIIGELVSNVDEKQNIEKLFAVMSQPRNTRRQDFDMVSSFCQNRNVHLARRYVDDDESDVVDDARIVKLLQFYRGMMDVMVEDHRTQFDGASHTTGCMSGGRYSGAASGARSGPVGGTGYSPSGVVAGTVSGITARATTLTAKFTEPHKFALQFDRLYPGHNSMKVECTICFEKAVPFLLLRKQFVKENLHDLVDNPLIYYYPEIMCSKCADFFCTKGQDPVKQPCYAAVPIVNLIGDSKQYYCQAFSNLTNYQIQQEQRHTLASTHTLGLPVKAVDSQLECVKFVIAVFHDIVKEHFDTTEMKEAFEQFVKSVK